MSLNASYFRVLLLQAIVFYAASIGRLRAELSVSWQLPPPGCFRIDDLVLITLPDERLALPLLLGCFLVHRRWIFGNTLGKASLS